MGPIAKAFFLDTPSLIDSAWRHLDYTFNREQDYRYFPAPHIQRRPFWHKPPFWFFAITVFFVSYGPTWDGLCTIVPGAYIYAARQVLALAVVGGTLYLARVGVPALAEIVRHRFARVQNDLTPGRRRAIIFIAGLPVLLLAGMGLGLAYYLHLPGDGVCGVEGWNAIVFARFMICVLAIVRFFYITQIPDVPIQRVLREQALILALVALFQWFVLVPVIEWLELAPTPVPEASDLPYLHVFEVFAPCIVIILVFAPLMARQAFATVSATTARRFQVLMRRRELFVQPTEPDASWRRIRYAIVYGPAYHLLQLFLLPAIAALISPAPWMYFWVTVAFLVSFFLLVWGNVSSRWQQLNTYIERWFLRGTPLLISVLVILVGVLRVLQFDYVSTILDAAPFGFVFGLVTMNYVLFWLVEYWMSHAAASQLLRLLGAGVGELSIPYQPTFALPQHGVRVVRQNRYLLSHNTGRFIVVGTRGPLGPLPGEGQPSEPDSHPPVTTFQSYYLTELFTKLGENTGNRQNHEKVADIEQRTGMYFFRMNLMIAAVTILFALVFVYEEYIANNAIDPVVQASAAVPERPVDLAKLLTPEPEKPVRPAIVVVGSGGGTRAALYTASVLNGLHELGVDGDIVLVSGVSGGGAALAYFAAHHDALTGPNATQPTADCGSEWKCFNERVKKPFIEDVLNGASEWRLYRKTALSKLLVESFERNLIPSQFKLGSVERLAFILNSAIVSHPAADSDLLKATLDPAKACDEAERTYKMMGGGRMIFTNLSNIDAFPTRQAPIPDVRLPYEIVRDPKVTLAAAATLNANFPPVFPNGRVRIHDDAALGCKDLSYYVTDGGTEENLGLLSALYALKSALAGIGSGPVRPIHVVIAEASAVSYDYGQDRGVSALTASKERLTGGLTNELIEDIKRELDRAPGVKSDITFHYLALPLAFRARGGFGTHWMYAKEYHLSDPRPRSEPWRNYLPFDWLRTGKATVNREQMEALWLMLHDRNPQKFCKPDTFKKYQAPDRIDPPKELPEAVKVQSWICGSPPGSEDRDLHLKKWEEFVAGMGPYMKP
jgi:patatin-like phospholipase